MSDVIEPSVYTFIGQKWIRLYQTRWHYRQRRVKWLGGELSTWAGRRCTSLNKRREHVWHLREEYFLEYLILKLKLKSRTTHAANLRRKQRLVLKWILTGLGFVRTSSSSYGSRNNAIWEKFPRAMSRAYFVACIMYVSLICIHFCRWPILVMNNNMYLISKPCKYH